MTQATIHKLRLQPNPFAKIKAGSKTIEMRLWDEKRRLIKIGDELVFSSLSEPKETLVCEVKALHRFPSFTAMCQRLPLVAMGYEGASLQAWLTQENHGMYAYYTPEDEARFGVVGIEVELKAQ
jgi:ASC-1-like (ASCH) protein